MMMIVNFVARVVTFFSQHNIVPGNSEHVTYEAVPVRCIIIIIVTNSGKMVDQLIIL